jgi:hypothetical protein
MKPECSLSCSQELATGSLSLTRFFKVVKKRGMHHLNPSGILINEQFVFRRELSTNKAAYRLMNYCRYSVIIKSDIAGIFGDFAENSC